MVAVPGVSFFSCTKMNDKEELLVRADCVEVIHGSDLESDRQAIVKNWYVPVDGTREELLPEEVVTILWDANEFFFKVKKENDTITWIEKQHVDIVHPHEVRELYHELLVHLQNWHTWFGGWVFHDQKKSFEFSWHEKSMGQILKVQILRAFNIAARKVKNQPSCKDEANKCLHLLWKFEITTMVNMGRFLQDIQKLQNSMSSSSSSSSTSSSSSSSSSSVYHEEASLLAHLASVASENSLQQLVSKFSVTVSFEARSYERYVYNFLFFFYFFFHCLTLNNFLVFSVANNFFLLFNIFSAKIQWKESMMVTGGRGYFMRSLTETLKRLKKFATIGSTLSLIPLSCHTAQFDACTSASTEGETSMAWHRDEVGSFTLIVTLGPSTSSYLEWKRGTETVRIDYSGHTFSVVGGIHSRFFDFSIPNETTNHVDSHHHVYHRSVNLGTAFREIIVLRFKMHATKELGINANTVAAFVDIIKSITYESRSERN